jgi:hypothetical protein
MPEKSNLLQLNDYYVDTKSCLALFCGKEMLMISLQAHMCGHFDLPIFPVMWPAGATGRCTTGAPEQITNVLHALWYSDTK